MATDTISSLVWARNSVSFNLFRHSFPALGIFLTYTHWSKLWRIFKGNLLQILSLWGSLLSSTPAYDLWLLFSSQTLNYVSLIQSLLGYCILQSETLFSSKVGNHKAHLTDSCFLGINVFYCLIGSCDYVSGLTDYSLHYKIIWAISWSPNVSMSRFFFSWTGWISLRRIFLSFVSREQVWLTGFWTVERPTNQLLHKWFTLPPCFHYNTWSSRTGYQRWEPYFCSFQRIHF